MKNQFWAGLGSQAILGSWADYEQLLRSFFMSSWAFFFLFFENIVGSAIKSCIEQWQKKNLTVGRILFSCFSLFYRLLWSLKFQCKYIKVRNKHLFSNLWCQYKSAYRPVQAGNLISTLIVAVQLSFTGKFWEDEGGGQYFSTLNLTLKTILFCILPLECSFTPIFSVGVFVIYFQI